MDSRDSPGGCTQEIEKGIQHMNQSPSKWLAMALGIVSLGLLVLSGGLFWNYGWLKIHVAFASEQTQIFDEMRTKALQSDPAGAAGCLEYVVNYYPSGTKQETGSRLDAMVERDRTQAIRDIVSHLRAKTGQDLGETPDAWIQKYAPR
jgi:hypothetical protein